MGEMVRYGLGVTASGFSPEPRLLPYPSLYDDTFSREPISSKMQSPNTYSLPGKPESWKAEEAMAAPTLITNP